MPINPTEPKLSWRVRGRMRVMSKRPRPVPEIESVPWRTKGLRNDGSPIIVSLPRVRFLEDDWPIKEGGKPLRPTRT